MPKVNNLYRRSSEFWFLSVVSQSSWVKIIFLHQICTNRSGVRWQTFDIQCLSVFIPHLNATFVPLLFRTGFPQFFRPSYPHLTSFQTSLPKPQLFLNHFPSFWFLMSLMTCFLGICFPPEALLNTSVGQHSIVLLFYIEEVVLCSQLNKPLLFWNSCAPSPLLPQSILPHISRTSIVACSRLCECLLICFSVDVCLCVTPYWLLGGPAAFGFVAYCLSSRGGSWDCGSEALRLRAWFTIRRGPDVTGSIFCRNPLASRGRQQNSPTRSACFLPKHPKKKKRESLRETLCLWGII